MRLLRSHQILIPLLALLAIAPLLIHGCSCGHDQPFHVQSWLDAAQQFRQGTLYPRWAFSPAWQAGEPRFVFYPPLSWVLGALLTMLFPMNAVPVVFTWIALTGAGFAIHYLASRYSTPSVALFCASVYIANPYMLFNAFERGAYAELLAAAWMPLVLAAALSERLTIASIAIPLGLTWLTNAPAGVMATYMLVLLAVPRVLSAERKRHAEHPVRAFSGSIPLVARFAGGIALGLGLVSFYLLPAAYERRYVQVAMAIIPNLRYQDNFLFGKTDYAAHNQITYGVSVLALILLAVTMLAILLGLRRKNTPSQASFPTRISLSLLFIAVAIAFLLTPASSLVWQYLPNLKYLQFPWRLLSVLSVVLAFSLVPVASRVTPRKNWLTWIFAAVAVLLLSQFGARLYRQGCEVKDYPVFEASAFRTNHGVLPTDEYTPGDADNDVQRTDDPSYWLVQGDPNAPAPGTVQNPNETIANYDGPIPFEDTVASRAQRHLDLGLETSQILVLNLRDYPAWHITRNGTEVPVHLHRDDGLVAVALPAGKSTIDVEWRRSWDQNLGVGITMCALGVLIFLIARSRKIESWP